MERVIYKYELSTRGESIPEGKIVKVAIDPKSDKICAWVEHEKLFTSPDPFTKARMTLFFVGTGWDFGGSDFSVDEIEHLESFVLESGMVWHVYKGT